MESLKDSIFIEVWHGLNGQELLELIALLLPMMLFWVAKDLGNNFA